MPSRSIVLDASALGATPVLTALRRPALCVALVGGALAFPRLAQAGDGEAEGKVELSSGDLSASGSADGESKGARGKHRVRLEGGLGILLGPQTDRFKTFGGGGAAAYEFRFLPYLAIEPRYTIYTFKLDGAVDGRGFAHMAGAHLRAYPIPKLKVGQLWIGAGPEMVFTARGADNIRGGLSAGTGFEFNANWAVALGPFIRYSHIFQPNDAPGGPQDAQFLQTGLSLAFGGKRPSQDQDKDGIKDKYDECVDVPEDLDSFQDLDGCPEADNDSDGIDDVSDACPNEAGAANDDPALNGCPAQDDSDRDGDGIPNAIDACPDEAEDMDGVNDEDGCPDIEAAAVASDQDEDGIPDAQDSCPTEPETVNGYQDEDGCPDQGPSSAVIKVLQEVGERIYFDTNESTITPEAAAALQRLAATMREHAEIAVLRIEGHADAQGSAAANQRLSEARAEAMKGEMIRLGVDPSRIQTRGYGERKLEVNSRGEERNNRRAVFRVMSIR